MSLIKARQIIANHNLLRYQSDLLIGRWIDMATSTEVTWVPTAAIEASRRESLFRSEGIHT